MESYLVLALYDVDYDDDDDDCLVVIVIDYHSMMMMILLMIYYDYYYSYYYSIRFVHFDSYLIVDVVDDLHLVPNDQWLSHDL